MRKTLKLSAFLSFIFICGYMSKVSAQNYSRSTNYKTTNAFHDDTLMKQNFWIELDLLLNPIYVSQFSSRYLLNKRPLSIKPGPRFYGVLPSQVPFANIAEIADQSNAIYANFSLAFFDKSKLTWLHHTRLMVGITHDKLETGSETVYYKFPNGGTELSVLLDKNISYKLSDLDFKAVNLIFNFDVHAGLFASLANIYTDISIPDTTIKSMSDARWSWQNKNWYLGGWGWLMASNVEIGGLFCRSYFISRKFTTQHLGKALFNVFRHIGFTIGARGMIEGLYTSSPVLVNSMPGYHLKVRNYGIFFAGPVVNLKYIKF